MHIEVHRSAFSIALVSGEWLERAFGTTGFYERPDLKFPMLRV
jgi:hypothetical protein